MQLAHLLKGLCQVIDSVIFYLADDLPSRFQQTHVTSDHAENAQSRNIR
jgi:hypothetical protein